MIQLLAKTAILPAILLMSIPDRLPSQSKYNLNYRYRDGYIVKVAGDQNKDGFTDILVGHPEAVSNKGQVKLVSGKNMRELKIWTGASSGARFGTSIAVGDMNGDKVPDYVVGAPGDNSGKGTFTVIDGKTLSFSGRGFGSSANASFGSSIVLADVYPFFPDKKLDVIVSAPNFSTATIKQAGAIEIYDNKSLKRVGGFTGSSNQAHLGTALASNGDLDGKPGDEIVVTAKGYYSSIGGCGGGYFEVISGGVWTTKRYLGPSRLCFGSSVLIEDVTGDKVKDIVIGTGFNNRTGGAYVWEWNKKLTVPGYKSTYSFPIRGRNFGLRIMSVPDMNKDGLADLCICGSDTVDFFAAKSYFKLGGFDRKTIRSIAAPGDLDHDGVQDFIVAGYTTSYPSFTGAVEFWSTKKWAFTPADNYILAKRGGRVALDIDMGVKNKGAFYLVLGSMSGASPGVKLGSVQFPLNIDNYSMIMTGLFNQPPFVNFLGFLDSKGKAQAFWTASPALGKFAPLYAQYAVLVIGYPKLQFQDASNARHFVLK